MTLEAPLGSHRSVKNLICVISYLSLHKKNMSLLSKKYIFCVFVFTMVQHILEHLIIKCIEKKMAKMNLIK